MLSAIVLAGGMSTRFGSDKSRAMLGENSLIDVLLNSLPQDMDIIVVGPAIEKTSNYVRFTREDPPGGGPVAAICAGLELIDTEFVAIIATDMPFASQIFDGLIGALPISEDALIPLDSEGVLQPLCALYRTISLRSAITKLGEVSGQSMRNLTKLLDVRELRLSPALERILIDIDTPSDLERAISLKAGNQRGVNAMDKWIDAVQKELGIKVDVDQESILNLARDAAHTIERKAAPITTFLLGIAVAGGADPKEAARQIELLAGNWPVDPIDK